MLPYEFRWRLRSIYQFEEHKTSRIGDAANDRSDEDGDPKAVEQAAYGISLVGLAIAILKHGGAPKENKQAKRPDALYLVAIEQRCVPEHEEPATTLRLLGLALEVGGIHSTIGTEGDEQLLKPDENDRQQHLQQNPRVGPTQIAADDRDCELLDGHDHLSTARGRHHGETTTLTATRRPPLLGHYDDHPYCDTTTTSLPPRNSMGSSSG